MSQSALAEAGFQRYSKQTRRQRFLQEKERVAPWEALLARIKPLYYPKRRGAGRPAVGLKRMLRIHFLQHGFNLSDPGVEEALYDSRAMRQFVGIDLGREPAPDETTICKFRHLLEVGGLGEAIFWMVGEHLKSRGLRISGGTILGATINNALSSTKNRDKRRDPEMHQTHKGNQWYCGMKAHIGVDADTKLIHSVATTSARVHDSQVMGALLHGEDRGVWGDSAHRGQGKAIREVASQAREFIQEKGARHRPGVDPLSWIPNPFGRRRNSRCHEHIPHTRLSFATRWWSWFAQVDLLPNWPATSSAARRPSASGSNRSTSTKAAVTTV